jgi:Lipoprotein LpqB beta-propeller domain
MRRRLVAASVALVALVLTGCATIPSSGPVQAGDPPPVDPANDVDILVRGPADGASQTEILDGFVRAALSPSNNYQVAREYLTDEFADEWQADAGATIDVLADRERVVVDDTTMRIDATPAASLLENGQYEEPDVRTPIPLRYHFTQVDGEWRISNAPTGILIDQVGFTQVFRDYTLYFLDPTFEYLVPDVRWFSGPESAQTSIVQAILAGPAEWLAPGVVSAFPEGVELVGAAFDELPTVQRMTAQLDASLIGVRDIDDVLLTLNGVDPGAPPLSPQPVENPRVDPRPAVFDGETFGYLATSGESVQPIEGLSDQVALLQPTGASLGIGAESAAVVNAEGVWSVRAGEEPVPLDPRDGLVTPAIDGQGVIWSVPASAPDELAWYAPDGSSEQVPVPWSGSSIAAIEVSRDSTRIAALLGDGGSTHFVVAAIERASDGRPIGLGPVALSLAAVAGTPLDVAWLDSRNVASITGVDTDATRIVTQELGGFARERGGPAAGVLVDGGNNDLRVVTADGFLDVPSGVGWQVRAEGIRFIASQQPD